MNRTVPLPLTGGIPQPLNSLADCIFSAECELCGRSRPPSTDGQGALTVLRKS